ncbi:hypothetical protein [Sphingomonas sp.]|jgi:hypothetical protein
MDADDTRDSLVEHPAAKEPRRAGLVYLAFLLVVTMGILIYVSGLFDRTG